MLLITCDHCHGHHFKAGQTQVLNRPSFHCELTHSPPLYSEKKNSRYSFSSALMSGGLVRTLLDTNDRNPTLSSFNNKEDILSVHLRSLRRESSGLTGPGAQIVSGNSLPHLLAQLSLLSDFTQVNSHQDAILLC